MFDYDRNTFTLIKKDKKTNLVSTGVAGCAARHKDGYHGRVHGTWQVADADIREKERAGEKVVNVNA